MVAVLAATAAAFPAVATPVTRPGWPVTVTVPGASWIQGTSIQFVDLDGDGQPGLMVSGLSAYAPSFVEYRRENGSLDRRFDGDGFGFAPVFVDREDDGRLESVLAGGIVILMFDSDGRVVWRRSRIVGDPVWGGLRELRLSGADLDGDGRVWFAGVGTNTEWYVFDIDGNLRPGWPVSTNGTHSSPPTVVDVDGDGLPELIAGNTKGLVLCFKADGSPCSGWPYDFRPSNGTAGPGFDLNAPVAWRQGEGWVLVAVSEVMRTQGRLPYLHVISADAAPVPPFPIGIPDANVKGRGLSFFENYGRTWASIVGDGVSFYYPKTHHLYDLTTGARAPGWPIASDIGAYEPMIADIGSRTPPIGMLMGGDVGFFGPGELRAYDMLGRIAPEFTRRAPTARPHITVGTFDGIETTVCWTTESLAPVNSIVVDCFDVGVPWSREKVQWGMYAFDHHRTSRFRRLWQIDRSRTTLDLERPAVPSSTSTTFRVTCKARQADGSGLGEDQILRFIRRPTLGRFVGPVRYDPATGDYWRLYESPALPAGETAEVEFRVFVNEELDDDRPILRVVGRPTITDAQPGGVPRRLAWTTVRLEGIDFGTAPKVISPDSSLSVGATTKVGPNAVTAPVRPPLAGPPTGRLAIENAEGLQSAGFPITIYDPTALLLTAREAANGTAVVEWFGPSWATTLERSPEPRFLAPKVLPQTGFHRHDDPDPATPIWYYRLR